MGVPKHSRLIEYWAQFTPEERRAIMEERKKKAPHNTPARIKAHRKQMKKQNKKMVEAARQWAKEHPEEKQKQARHMQEHPNGVKSREKFANMMREKSRIESERKRRAEAIIKYQTNLNIKRVTKDTDNDVLIDEFFGEGF